MSASLLRFLEALARAIVTPLAVEAREGHLGYRYVDGRWLPFVSGGAEGDDATPDKIEVPEDLTGLDETAKRDLFARLQTRYEAIRAGEATKESIEEMKAIRGHQSAIADALTAELADRQKLADDLTALDQSPALPDAPAPVGDDALPPVGEAPAVPAPVAVAADAVAPVAVAAGLTPADIAANRPPQSDVVRQPTPITTRPRVAMLASSSQQRVPHTSEVDLATIGAIVEDVKHGLDGRRERVRSYVAAVPAFAIDGYELLSDLNGAARNDALIGEAVESWKARRDTRLGRATSDPNAARTAAICAPLEALREIPNYSTDADPFGDAFPQRGVGRGGFTYTPAIRLADVDAGVQAGWSDTDQDGVDPDDDTTWKPCIDIACGSPSDVKAEASTACFTFDVTTEMSNPERVRDIMAKLAAARIRARTVRLLEIFDDNAYNFTQVQRYAAWPDVIYAVENALARGVYAERLDVEDYTIFLPPGLVESFVADIQAKGYLPDAEVAASARDLISRMQTITGTEVVQLRDEILTPFSALPALDTATALPPWPLDTGPDRAPRIRIAHPGSAIYFSTGEIATGIESSPALARQNKRQWFSEEFVGLAKHGSPPWFRLDVNACPNGARAGLEDPAACATS